MQTIPQQLKQLPLFANVTEAHLAELVAAFDEISAKPGDVLFEAAQVPKRFLILIDGEVALQDEGQERFVLRPMAPVGELGAITGLTRNMTAVARTPSKLLSISVQGLMDFCENNGDVAFPIHHNLLRVVADKVGRDLHRIEEMRSNIISTQKAMKRMRDALLEAEDTPLTKQLFEELETLIAQNKKGRYVVEPSRTAGATVRLDNGTLTPVLAISKERLLFAGGSDTPKKGGHWSGVLVAPGREIPLSGTVESAGPDQNVIVLDLLIDDYAAELDNYLTRLQMLDVVV